MIVIIKLVLRKYSSSVVKSILMYHPNAYQVTHISSVMTVTLRNIQLQQDIFVSATLENYCTSSDEDMIVKQVERHFRVIYAKFMKNLNHNTG